MQTDSSLNPTPKKKFDLEKPVKINYTSQGKIIITSSTCFTTEYLYINDISNSCLHATKKFCGFEIFIDGKDKSVLKSNLIGSHYKSQLVEIQYKTSFYKKKKPRSFIVNMKHLIFTNKEPFYNTDTKSYSLNFNGRVTVPSVKNFQLVHPLDKTYILLTFGKIGANTYVMDYKYPLTAVDAFSICLAALDNKYFCD
jgi:hypothetical protein